MGDGLVVGAELATNVACDCVSEDGSSFRLVSCAVDDLPTYHHELLIGRASLFPINYEKFVLSANSRTERHNEAVVRIKGISSFQFLRHKLHLHIITAHIPRRRHYFDQLIIDRVFLLLFCQNSRILSSVYFYHIHGGKVIENGRCFSPHDNPYPIVLAYARNFTFVLSCYLLLS